MSVRTIRNKRGEVVAQTAADYQRQFETLVAQLDGLNAPPPARRPGVKAPPAGIGIDWRGGAWSGRRG